MITQATGAAHGANVDGRSTQSLLSDRLSAHEKRAWMLRASLGPR